MTLTSSQVTDYILDYKSGNPQAGEHLFKHYHGFIYKYYYLLISGEYNPIDHNVVAFLKMLGKTNQEKTAEILRYLLSSYDNEDLWQECVVAFFETVYKGNNVSYYYKYILTNRVKALLSQILPTTSLIKSISIEDLETPAKEDTLDSRWVEGWTSQIFSSLTPDERQFILWVWQDHLPSEELCKILEISPRTLTTRKKLLREKLSKLLRIN